MEVDADADAVWGRGSGSARWDGESSGSPRMRRCWAKCINDAALILGGLIQ